MTEWREPVAVGDRRQAVRDCDDCSPVAQFAGTIPIDPPGGHIKRGCHLVPEHDWSLTTAQAGKGEILNLRWGEVDLAADSVRDRLRYSLP